MQTGASCPCVFPPDLQGDEDVSVERKHGGHAERGEAVGEVDGVGALGGRLGARGELGEDREELGPAADGWVRGGAQGGSWGRGERGKCASERRRARASRGFRRGPLPARPVSALSGGGGREGGGKGR